jgi:hypothetical protein
MAKQAKDVEVELPDSAVIKAVKDILAHYEHIESERGKFMLSARREREAMGSVYESMAQRGVAQKVMKIEIKIIRAIEKIKGWQADLEDEETKLLTKLARAQGDMQQLSLFGELPVVEIHKRKAPAKKAASAKGKTNVTPLRPPVEEASPAA